MRAAIHAGAGAVGFVFAKSVRRVTPEAAAVICNDVPGHVRRVAVMLHPANDEWQNVLQKFSPDVLQADADDFESLDIPASIECWPVFREGRTQPDTSGIYVYEGLKSGQGESVDWSLAAKVAAGGRMILAGGLAAHNVSQAVKTVRPYGVDVSSAVETLPGRKDSELIKDFVVAAMAAEKAV